MKLKLNNPIVFFDLETTGINITTDRIVELKRRIQKYAYQPGNAHSREFICHTWHL